MEYSSWFDYNMGLPHALPPVGAEIVIERSTCDDMGMYHDVFIVMYSSSSGIVINRRGSTDEYFITFNQLINKNISTGNGYQESQVFPFDDYFKSRLDTFTKILDRVGPELKDTLNQHEVVKVISLFIKAGAKFD